MPEEDVEWATNEGQGSSKSWKTDVVMRDLNICVLLELLQGYATIYFRS